MALMHLASRWLAIKRRSSGAVAVLTVDHGLRAESAAEAAFVAAQAERLGFAHATLRWEGDKPKTGIQAAARRARYSLMTAYCVSRNIACLVTAHTEDDQAETFLMRLRRGSGLDGLAAMAAVSAHGGVPLVRPLLGVSKARLIAYVRSLAIPYVNDMSNSSLHFERVRLRHAMKAFASAGVTAPAVALKRRAPWPEPGSPFNRSGGVSGAKFQRYKSRSRQNRPRGLPCSAFRNCASRPIAGCRSDRRKRRGAAHAEG